MESIAFTRHGLAGVSQVLNVQTLVHCAALYVTKLAPLHALEQQQHHTALLLSATALQLQARGRTGRYEHTTPVLLGCVTFCC